MENQNLTTVEIKVQRFIAQYGSEQLIQWLDEFDFMGGEAKFSLYKKLERIACDTYSISIADMHHRSSTACTNTKRSIAHIAFNHLNLSPGIIAKLFGNMALRSIHYYLKETDEWINNPRMNRVFYENYVKIIDKFKIDQNAKD